MATIKIVIDPRREDAQGRSPLRLSLRCGNKSALLALGAWVYAGDWMADAQRVSPRSPAAESLNRLLALRQSQAESCLYQLEASAEPVTMEALRRAVADMLGREPRAPKSKGASVLSAMERHRALKTRAKTASSYTDTIRRLQAFDPHIESVMLDDVTPGWLKSFDAFMAQTSKSANARGVHMRNLRAAFNTAIDDGLTSNYPFRRFSIKRQPTAKRSLTAEQARALIAAELSPSLGRYRDLFVLSLALMGINPIDLLSLPAGADARGRIEFARSKTGHQYSMLVEPEAAALIDALRGERHMVYPLDHVGNYDNFLRRWSRAMREISAQLGLPPLSTYWARHTWATLAAGLDIPKETIGAALGHADTSVTSIYIRFDHSKVDEANRKVLDLLFKPGGKDAGGS